MINEIACYQCSIGIRKGMPIYRQKDRDDYYYYCADCYKELIGNIFIDLDIPKLKCGDCDSENKLYDYQYTDNLEKIEICRKCVIKREKERFTKIKIVDIKLEKGVNNEN